MGIISRLWNATAAPSQEAFAFADGNKLTPSEFGYGLMRWSHEPARELFESCFGENGPGVGLPGGDLIVSRPFVAHLYLTAVYVGWYLAYVRTILNASHAIMAEVDKGLSNSLKELLQPDGSPFGETERNNLRGVMDMFARAATDDIKKSVDADPDVYDPKPGGRTFEILVGVLDGAYRDDDGPMFLVSDNPDFVRLEGDVATVSMTVLTLLSKRLKLRIVSRSV